MCRLGVASTNRLAHFLASEQEDNAKLVARSSSLLAVWNGCFTMTMILLFRESIARIFTVSLRNNVTISSFLVYSCTSTSRITAVGHQLMSCVIQSDIEVITFAIAIFPWAAAFQVVDSLQACNSGCLRAMGRADIAATFNFVAYYSTSSPTLSPDSSLLVSWFYAEYSFAGPVVAIPLGLVVGFYCQWGLHGLWFGVSTDQSTHQEFLTDGFQACLGIGYRRIRRMCDRESSPLDKVCETGQHRGLRRSLVLYFIQRRDFDQKRS